MKIHHVAIWVSDLEKMRSFYIRYFNASSGKLYFNPKKEFKSYFLTFEGDCSIEIMTNPFVTEPDITDNAQTTAYTHVAISVGGRHLVDQLTEQLRKDGYEVISEPRTTGDGYYESVVMDPENNIIEITE